MLSEAHRGWKSNKVRMEKKQPIYYKEAIKHKITEAHEHARIKEAQRRQKWFP